MFDRSSPPALPADVVDAHHHLWDPDRPGSEWLADPALAAIRRRYGLAELEAVVRPWGVAATVLVQTLPELDETIEFCGLAESSRGLVAGVVGWVDLTLGAGVSAQIEQLRSVPGGDRLVGIRHLVQSEADREWLRRPDVTAGVAVVGRAGLVYDLLVLTDQLASAAAITGALDEVSFVLDHAAKPPFRGSTDEWDSWRSGITQLATRPNVSCKLSGLATEADWESWTDATLAPAVEHVLDVFGPDRVMFGSDWPVCELAGRYDEIVSAASALTASCTAAERCDIFGVTARRVYSL